MKITHPIDSFIEGQESVLPEAMASSLPMVGMNALALSVAIAGPFQSEALQQKMGNAFLSLIYRRLKICL
jgi:hypothetical protein